MADVSVAVLTPGRACLHGCVSAGTVLRAKCSPACRSGRLGGMAGMAGVRRRPGGGRVMPCRCEWRGAVGRQALRAEAGMGRPVRWVAQHGRCQRATERMTCQNTCQRCWQANAGAQSKHAQRCDGRGLTCCAAAGVGRRETKTWLQSDGLGSWECLNSDVPRHLAAAGACVGGVKGPH